MRTWLEGHGGERGARDHSSANDCRVALCLDRTTLHAASTATLGAEADQFLQATKTGIGRAIDVRPDKGAASESASESTARVVNG